MKPVYEYVIKELGDKIVIDTKSLTDDFKDTASMTIRDPELRNYVKELLHSPMEEYEYGLYIRDGVLQNILKNTRSQAKKQLKSRKQYHTLKFS